MESREVQHRDDVRMPQHIQRDRAPTPWDASVREFQKGQTGYIVEALEQPLLLPKDMDGYRRFSQNDIFLSLKKDLAIVNYSSTHKFTYQIVLLFLIYSIFVIFGQITQQVFVAKEWYCEANNGADAEALTRANVEKSLGVVKQEQLEMSEKTELANQACSSAEAGLKTVERQAEEQRQKLHSTEIDLATQKQMVIDLQAQLQKAKEEVQLAKEVVEAEKKASYQLSVEETEIRLAKELSEVCHDYCDVTWDKALTIAGVPTDSALRLPRNIYYNPQIREIPYTSSPSTPAPESSRQPLAVLDALPPPKISKESNQAGDQGWGLREKRARTKGRSHQPRPKMPQK